MLSRGLRTSARRSISAATIIRRPAAQVAQSSRSFVQPTHIDRATVIDAPHIPSEAFSPSSGRYLACMLVLSDRQWLNRMHLPLFPTDSLGFSLEPIKQNDRPIYLDMQVSGFRSICPKILSI